MSNKVNNKNKKILVVGLGLIGSSLCRSLRKNNSYNNINGHDISKEVMEYALDNNYIDNFELDLGNAIEDSDIIVFCVPVDQIKNLLKIAKPFFNGNKVFTETLSTKKTVLDFIKDNKFQDVNNFILSHPMAGTENFGIKNSLDNLYDEAITFISSLHSSKLDNINSVKYLWESVNCNIVEIDAFKHDKILAAISHAPHAISFSLSKMINDLNTNEKFPWIYSKGSLSDMTRISNSDPESWANIFSDNEDNMIEYINKYLEELKELKSKISSKNHDDIVSFLNRATPKK